MPTKTERTNDQEGFLTETVWDGPRPPRVEVDYRPGPVESNTESSAASDRFFRGLEARQPPTRCFPGEALVTEFERSAAGTTYREWEAQTSYVDVVVSQAHDPRVARTKSILPDGYEVLAGILALQPARVACTLEGVRARAQEGRTRGGWLTARISGASKGLAGHDTG